MITDANPVWKETMVDLAVVAVLVQMAQEVEWTSSPKFYGPLIGQPSLNPYNGYYGGGGGHQ